MVEPTWTSVFQNIIGPWGAVFVLCLVVYFLWKLFREEQAESRRATDAVATLTDTVRELTIEVRAWRSGRRSSP